MMKIGIYIFAGIFVLAGIFVFLEPILGNLPLGGAAANAEETSVSSIDAERDKILKDFSIDKIPNLDEVRTNAREVLGKGIGDQSVENLKIVAERSNYIANLIGFIEEEYDDYYRENYKYDFVQEKIVNSLDSYRELGNEFKDYRNQSYFNMGVKSKEEGKTLAAFLYFRDAYRLSTFSCSDGVDDCMRLKAEKEMKSMLGIDGIKSYVHWQ